MTEPRAGHPPTNVGPEGDGGVSLLWLAAVLVRERRVLMAVTAVGLVLSLVAALLRERSYTTAFSFLPQAGQDPSRAGLASLAGQFGISLGALSGAAEPPQLYADLLVTRGVLEPIARDSFAGAGDAARLVPLPDFLKIRGENMPIRIDKTLRKLRLQVISTTVATRTTGMVTVRVRTKSAAVSLAIAERLLQGLNTFNLITRQSQAREERRFTEGRLEEARTSLRSAEDVLQRFYQANREFTSSPALTFQRDRLQREVTLQQQVVASLAQQYEENRIREVRDTPVITVIEVPRQAARPDPGLRILIVFAGVVAGLFTGVLLVLVRDAWSRHRSTGHDPALAMLSTEWRHIRDGFGRKAV